MEKQSTNPTSGWPCWRAVRPTSPTAATDGARRGLSHLLDGDLGERRAGGKWSKQR